MIRAVVGVFRLTALTPTLSHPMGEGTAIWMRSEFREQVVRCSVPGFEGGIGDPEQCQVARNSVSSSRMMLPGVGVGNRFGFIHFQS